MKPVGQYHEYVRNFTNKTSVNLRCSFRAAPRYCKATLTLEPKDLRIIETEKKEGKRDKHFLKSDEHWTKLMLESHKISPTLTKMMNLTSMTTLINTCN